MAELTNTRTRQTSKVHRSRLVDALGDGRGQLHAKQVGHVVTQLEYSVTLKERREGEKK